MTCDNIYYNPADLDGFEFIEFCTLQPKILEQQFEQLGFTKIATHKSKQMSLFRQGQINFIINNEPHSYAVEFASKHGACACAMGFRTKNASKAMQRVLARGAEEFHHPEKKGELAYPAIYGIGGSLIYFIEDYDDRGSNYLVQFNPIEGVNQHPKGAGLVKIDHLTHNLKRGNMEVWADFYYHLFAFRDIRYFDIQGHYTGLISRALSSPCNEIRIPLNESTDDQSQIEEFIHDFRGEGIQHIALRTDDIYQTVEALRKNQVAFMDVPETYFEMIEERLPGHGEDLVRLHKNYILIDGTTKGERRLLLQIFTNTMLGPVFFEIIQRKGDEGFGEGNFKALFESIERDQIRRGVIKEN